MSIQFHTAATFGQQDFRTWIALVVFLLEIVLVHFPFTVPVPYPTRSKEAGGSSLRWTGRLNLPFNYATGPVIGAVILVATTTLTWSDVGVGIIGSGEGGGIEPLSVLILVYSLAYICVSLDRTGLFSYLALMVVTWCGGSGLWLYIGFFFLTVVVAALASNDVVILTFSPLVCYLADALHMDPWPLLIAEFVAANTASMALYVGNPTNVVVSMAYDITFLTYSQFLSLPFLTATLIELVVLLALFWHHIPRSLSTELQVAPRSALLRPGAAIFGSCVLSACLVALIVSSLWHVSVWLVTLPFALLVLGWDIIEDLRNWNSSRLPSDSMTEETKTGIESIEAPPPCIPDNSSPIDVPLPATKSDPWWVRRFPLTFAVLYRLPWGILPFLLGMFVSIQSIQLYGWTRMLAQLFLILLPTAHPIAWCLGIGVISAILCGLLNNLPAAILLANALALLDFTPHPVAGAGAVLGLIVACNLGALLTPAGSLAGLMWQDILIKKDRPPQRNLLAKCALIILPITLAVSLFTVVLQLYIFPDHLTSELIPR